MSSERTTIELDDGPVTGELLWEADFSDPDAFQVEAEGGTVEFTGDALEVDCTGGAHGVTVWTPREFPEDVLVEYAATCHEDEQDSLTSGRNLNCFLAATGDDGRPETLAETGRTGAYGEYHELPNYVFTLTWRHTRMRRDPGFELRSELVLGSQANHSYDVAVLKRGDRLAASVDGTLLHDWRDPDPHGSGWVGLRTWNTAVTYDRWTVYELE